MIPLQTLASLQYNPEKIRNVSVIAHVDHGKTTLTDSLIASNGIISDRLVGRIRYLDNTEEEQIRGITMKASAIALLFQREIEKEKNEEEKINKDMYLINLIDSPGHVDFSSDVSTAVRLCDGALLLVDAVEGICAQTHAVLKQAWQERVQSCLIINKIDRLILEMGYSPFEAYQHIRCIIEQANALLSSLITSNCHSCDETNDLESKHLFCPTRGNVLFASAFDGWAFGLGNFVKIASKRLNSSLPLSLLKNALWGDFYYHPKEKKIYKKPPLGSSSFSSPLFVIIILEPIWAIYKAVMISHEPKMIQKIIERLELKISDRDLNHRDHRITLDAILRKWLPLSEAVLKMTIRVLPSPIAAQSFRIHRLLPFSSTCSSSLSLKNIQTSMIHCYNTCNDPLVVYISKVLSIERKCFSEIHRLSSKKNKNENENENDQEDLVLVAFARVYSGILDPSIPFYVLGPKYNPPLQSLEIQQQEKNNPLPLHAFYVTGDQIQLYMIMGREFFYLDKVPAGNIVAIIGLDSFVLKTATLSSSLSCKSLTPMPFQAMPIVRVAIEPQDPCQMSRLENGLQMLYRSDPTVQVTVLETGEHVIDALGELHLERCIKDLIERFAKIPLHVSEPLIQFRETIAEGNVSSTQLQAFQLEEKEIYTSMTNTPDGNLSLKVQAFPLPLLFSQYLDTHMEQIKQYLIPNEINKENKESLKNSLFDILHHCKEDLIFPFQLSDIISFGPKQVGSNVLVFPKDKIGEEPWPFNRFSLFTNDENDKTNENLLYDRILRNVVSGFQLATASGPMCEEPLYGVAFVIEEIKWMKLDEELNFEGGQVISTMKSACRNAFIHRPLRLVEALFDCKVSCPSEQLGRLYGVISKRRGIILDEELSQGTTVFIVHAKLPVVESLGLSSAMLEATSGGASNPQLTFSHWEIISLDPYFQPQTEEEKEDYGESVEFKNYVYKYIEKIRKRKGLYLQEKIVLSATKQRTLTRNK